MTAPPRRVLIVDDAEDLRQVLRIVVGRAEGLEVAGEAVDGLDGIDKARELQPDVVILDVSMPVMDGLEALPLIREAAPETRIIVLSGFNDATMAEHARAAGADHYVVKGKPLPELVALLKTV